MNDIPLTYAETRAEAATKNPSMRVNLANIRDAVYQILRDWRGAGFFTEYTDHSFDHVLDMLTTSEWVIPDETRAIMTDADWLLLVLSIYFHDLGLLVTKQEYDARGANSDFQRFTNDSILPSDKQREYSARLAQLDPDEADRFQYQEFVRYSHGKRVAAWLNGHPLDDGGASASAAKLIGELAAPLDETFRADLALTCESHTLDNIEDTQIYRVSRPYGGPSETANVQYIAVILRTVDLLQITRRRAPSVLYQLINPSNPLSQVEWQKQSAVRAVRASPARDREGNASTVIPSDTIEVHATFKEPAGFFALTSYISYAERELSKSYSVIQRSAKDLTTPYRFYWKYIDSQYIDTLGFLQESFEFELDQHKILDLLTGHTLYNNSTVVLRELTQNALDAVRLQCQNEGRASETFGRVDIIWNSEERSLTVADNGTGMSQRMVVDHLLKVGSSRYQDPKFKEANPEFHSISRFGIGVLSTFMVSDDVEITTCHPDDEKARRIALQSVHGKYLIKLLDKVGDASHLPMLPHGTAVKIKLRATAQIGDVLKVARSWIMFPRCRVNVIIDNDPPISVGFESPKQALEGYLDQSFRKSRFKAEYEVREASRDGVSLAFAVAKDELFQDWGFVTIMRNARGRDDDDFVPVATCIEGVAVEQSSPGFIGQSIVAVANAVGPSAPRTNVARSALEDTEEQRNMLRTIYKLFAEHVTSEVERLSRTDSYSLSRAVGVAPFISSPLTSPSVNPSKGFLLSEAMSTVPLVLIEDGDVRRSISLDELTNRAEFTTIESPLYRSIEYFVKEAPANVTARNLLTTLGNKTSSSSTGPVVCNITSSSYIESNIRQRFDIFEVLVSPENRTVELRWRPRETEARWLSASTVFDDLLLDDVGFISILSEARDRLRQGRNGGEPMNVPLFDMRTSGLEAYAAFISNRERYLKPGTGLTNYMAGIYRAGSATRLRELATHFVLLDVLQGNGWAWEIMNDELLDRAMAATPFSQLRTFVKDRKALVVALRDTPSRTFDAFAWDRREGDVDAFLHF